jgi:hypothetical protein
LLKVQLPRRQLDGADLENVKFYKTTMPKTTMPGELDVSCLDCHHNATMPVAALLPRYPAETPFPEV